MGEKTLIKWQNKTPRQRLLFGVLLLSGWLWCSAVQAMDVVLALTQVQGRKTSLDGDARTQMIINHLKRLDAEPVAVLVRTREMTAKTQSRIAAYSNAGHLLVNQGHRFHLLSRPDLHRYQTDLLLANSRLRDYAGYRGHVYFANFETTAENPNRARLMAFAREKMFTPIYVSVQVQDSHLNDRYQQLVNRGRRVDMAALQDAHVDMIWRQLLAYAPLLRATHGNAPLVLLLEEHDLTAYFLPGLIDRIREGGGRLVAPQQVFTNPPVYPLPVNVHTADGFRSAMLGLEPPRRITPLIAGGDKQWVDQFLAARGLLQ